MPKLPSLTPKKVIKKLKKLGYVKDHTTGSHLIFCHPESKRRAVVPLHLKDIPKGTLHSLFKEAGIDREEFLKA